MTMSVNLNLGGLGGGGVGKAAKAGCGSIFGVLFGILLVPLGFYLIYHGEARLVNHGKVFEGVEMASPEAAANVTGLVKIKGQPVGQFLSHTRWDGLALYFRNTVEEYEREEDADGDVDYEWNQVSSEQMGGLRHRRHQGPAWKRQPGRGGERLQGLQAQVCWGLQRGRDGPQPRGWRPAPGGRGA